MRLSIRTILIIAVFTAIAFPLAANAQTPIPAGTTHPSVPAASSPAAPPAAGPILAGQPALVTPQSQAFVQISNRNLFPVTSWGEESAQERAYSANLKLADGLRALSGAAPASQLPTASADVRNGVEVLLLNRQYLLTVTEQDADQAGQTPAQLADVWANDINMAFQEAVREQQPKYLRWAAIQAGVVVLLGIVMQGLIWFLTVRLGRQLGWPLQILLWILIGTRIVDLFPVTRAVEPLFLTGALRPLAICLSVSLPAAILVRGWGFLLRRIFPPMPEHLTSQDLAHRTILRRVTLARVAEVTGATMIWFVAAVIGISLLGINLGALLTSAGLIGVALGFVAQDSIRDLLGGIYILVDDRFGVGDTIQVGAFDGRVERLNLRVTQIRDMSGRLITISNRNATDVANLTARWAQVDFKIGISYYDDLQKAMDLLKTTAQTLVDAWPERVLDPPEMLGVDSFSDLSVVLRLIIRTPPGDQWAVARELRARVKTAFDEAGIAILNNLYIPASLPAAHFGMIPNPAPESAPATDSLPPSPNGHVSTADPDPRQ